MLICHNKSILIYGLEIAMCHENHTEWVVQHR